MVFMRVLSPYKPCRALHLSNQHHLEIAGPKDAHLASGLLLCHPCPLPGGMSFCWCTRLYETFYSFAGHVKWNFSTRLLVETAGTYFPLASPLPLMSSTVVFALPPWGLWSSYYLGHFVRVTRMFNAILPSFCRYCI